MIIPRTAVLSDKANSAQIINYVRQNLSKAYRRQCPLRQKMRRA